MKKRVNEISHCKYAKDNIIHLQWRHQRKQAKTLHKEDIIASSFHVVMSSPTNNFSQSDMHMDTL